VVAVKQQEAGSLGASSIQRASRAAVSVPSGSQELCIRGSEKGLLKAREEGETMTRRREDLKRC